MIFKLKKSKCNNLICYFSNGEENTLDEGVRGREKPYFIYIPSPKMAVAEIKGAG